MSLADLESSEREVVRQCLLASVHGPFFPEEEFHTLFGLWRSEVTAILDRWPDIDGSDASADIAINNSLLNLLYYPHGCDNEWAEFITVSPKEVAIIYEKLKGGRVTDSEYFDNIR